MFCPTFSKLHVMDKCLCLEFFHLTDVESERENVKACVRVLQCRCMGKRSSSTRRRTGIQFATPAQACISAMKGSGTARKQKDWFPTTFRFGGARKGPRGVCKDGTLCVRRHFSGMGTVASSSIRTMSTESDLICVSFQTDALENDFKDARAL